MAIKDISVVCDRCGGDGMEEVTVVDPPAPPVEQTCGACDGAGFLITGQLDDDLVTALEKLDNIPADLSDVLSDMADKVNDVLDKCNDIKEVVDEL